MDLYLVGFAAQWDVSPTNDPAGFRKMATARDVIRTQVRHVPTTLS